MKKFSYLLAALLLSVGIAPVYAGKPLIQHSIKARVLAQKSGKTVAASAKVSAGHLSNPNGCPDVFSASYFVVGIGSSPLQSACAPSNDNVTYGATWATISFPGCAQGQKYSVEFVGADLYDVTPLDECGAEYRIDYQGGNPGTGDNILTILATRLDAQGSPIGTPQEYTLRFN